MAFTFNDDFTLLQEPQPWRLQLGSPASVVELDNSYSLSGPTSLRMYLPVRLDYTNARAQYDWVGGGGTGIPTKAPVFTTTGVKFAVYFPDTYKNDPNREILFQQHGVGAFSPPLSVAVLDGTIYVWIYGNPVVRGYDPNYSYLYDNLGTVAPGTWHYFVLNSYWDYRDYNAGGTGYCKVYMSIGSPCSASDLVVDHNNPNCYNDDGGLNPILNIYKWQWNDSVRAQNSIDAGVTEREWWFDDYTYQDSDIFVSSGTPLILDNKIQGLLNVGAGGIVQLDSVNTYRENTQVTIPANTTLDLNGATVEPLSGLWRSTWDGNLHHEDFIFKISDGAIIKNGPLDGLNQSGWGGINVNNNNDIRIENMTAKLFRFTTTYLFNSTNVVITNNRFWESSIQPDNWESKYLFWNYLYNAEISYNEFSGVNGGRGLAGGGINVKYNGGVYNWQNVDIHHNVFNLFPKHGWVNPVSGLQGANYALEINSNFNGTGLKFRNNISNCGISFMRKNVTTNLNNDAYLADNRFTMGAGATLCYEFENVHMTIERDYVVGAGYTFGYFGKLSLPNFTRNIIVKHSIFHLGGNNSPTLLFANGGNMDDNGVQGSFEMTNCTIYCSETPTQLFNNSSSIGNTLRNYKIHKCIFVNKTGTTIPISYAPKAGWDISDNKFEGNWNLQEWTNNEMVTNALTEVGSKPDTFYDSNYVGYGAIISDTPTVTIPDAPSNITVTAVTSNSISLAWNDNSNNEDGFILSASYNGIDWNDVQLGPDTIQYVHSGIAPDTLVTYKVKAYNSAGESAYSLPVDGKTSVGANGIFTEIFDSLSNPPWLESGLGTIELSQANPLIGPNALRLYLPAVKGVYAPNGIDARSQVDYNPAQGDVPLKYPAWGTVTGQQFAFYLPADYDASDVFTTAIYAQRQADSAVFTTAEPLSIYLQGGYIRITHRTSPITDRNSIVTVDDAQVMPITQDGLGHWYYFVINSKWDYNGGGYHKIYLRIDNPPNQSNIVIDYTGATGYNDLPNESVYTYFTNYKWSWGDDANVQISLDAGITGVELFVDDITLQDADIYVPTVGEPAKPSNFRVTNTTNSTIELAWNDNSDNEDAFVLSYSDDNINWTEIQIQNNTESYTHSGLLENQTFFYKIKSINAVGSSPNTDVISGTTSSNPPTGPVPNAPNNLTLTSTTRNSIEMSWQDNSTDEDNFVVSFSFDGSVWFDTVLNADTTSFVHTGLNSDTLVYYKVKAVNVNGSSIYSNTVSIKTLPIPNAGWKYRRRGKNKRGSLLVNGTSVFI